MKGSILTNKFPPNNTIGVMLAEAKKRKKFTKINLFFLFRSRLIMKKVIIVKNTITTFVIIPSRFVCWLAGANKLATKQMVA